MRVQLTTTPILSTIGLTELFSKGINAMKLDVNHMDFDWDSCGEALAGLPQDADWLAFREDKEACLEVWQKPVFLRLF